MTNPETSTQTNKRYAGLFRRLFAIAYDTFLLIAILFIVTGIANVLNQGKAIDPGDSFYPVYVFVVAALCYLYFAWFWVNGGQTLGMKTWRIQLTTIDETQIDWKRTTIRFVTAIISWSIFGLGFIWAFFDGKKRCWHDIATKTVLLDLRQK